MTSPLLDHPLLTSAELRLLAERIAAHVPYRAETDGSPRRAAVALVFRAPAGGDTELLVIRRAEREGDPWSGQMGLPGGGQAPNERSLEDTAIRETLEETGVDIHADGHVLGALDENRPRFSRASSIIVRRTCGGAADVVLYSTESRTRSGFRSLWRDTAHSVSGSRCGDGAHGRASWWGTIVWGRRPHLRSLLQMLDKDCAARRGPSQRGEVVHRPWCSQI